MNTITLLNARDNLIKVQAVGDCIAEYYADHKKKDLLRIKLYDPCKNTVQEIGSGLSLVRCVEAVNCIWNSSDLYFTACTITSEQSVRIDVYQLEVGSRKQALLASFVRDLHLLQDGNRIKIFILSETVLLVQTEVLQTEVTENRIGNIGFSLSLLKLDQDGEIDVVDTNFINNGIHTITPVSDNKIMIKTGFSWIEDARMDDSEDSGAFIEGVYIATTSQLIADMTIASDTMDLPLIESAYKDKFITTPVVSGVYTHFTIVSPDGYESRCIFYNHETGERLEYNAGLLRIEDCHITYVVNGQPYIRNTLRNEINFLNLKKAEMDISFYDEVFVQQVGNLFVLYEKGKKGRMHVYTHPGLKRVISEEREFAAACTIGNAAYIYC